MSSSMAPASVVVVGAWKIVFGFLRNYIWVPSVVISVRKVKVADRQFPRRLQLVPPLSPEGTHMITSGGLRKKNELLKGKSKKTYCALLPLLHDHPCCRLAHHVHHVQGTFHLCYILCYISPVLHFVLHFTCVTL